MDLIRGCHSETPYTREVKADPADPNRVSIEDRYLHALLRDLEAVYEDRR